MEIDVTKLAQGMSERYGITVGEAVAIIQCEEVKKIADILEKQHIGSKLGRKRRRLIRRIKILREKLG